MYRRRALSALLAAGCVGAAALVPVQPASAATRLTCSASVSNAAPRQNSTIHVFVRTAASASVSTTAYYKTTRTTHRAKASVKGVADVPYRISRATKGYRVKVAVTVVKGTSRASCVTSFTPR